MHMPALPYTLQPRRRAWLGLAGLACLLSLGSPTAAQEDDTARNVSSLGLTAFRSDAEFRAYLRSLRTRQDDVQYEAAPPVVVSAPPPPAPMAEAASEISVTGSRVAQPNITNNQEADVDEGGIVKVSGDTLVILRRGRLFTVSLAGGGMRAVDSIDAFPPGVSARGDWYDEMLLSGDRVIVVGYSYGRGGTEINRFRLDRAGRLRFEDAHHLRSNDYYSSRNYASRLIGNRLIFYTPLYLDWERDPLEALPGIRRWGGDASARTFRRIATARQIYIAPSLRKSRRAEVDTLHSVTTCDLTAPVLGCSAIGVLGPSSRTFYVSGQAVYLWTSDARSGDARRRGALGHVYRLPFSRERPSAIGARGAPVDQFSFREDAVDGILNVLVRADGGGDAMFMPELSADGVALLRLPLRDFGNGSREAPRARYRPLPRPTGDSWSFHNRFVGGHVLYGLGGGDRSAGTSVFAAPLRGGPVASLALPHPVDRIEVLGRDAMIVGSGARGLGFTTVELPAESGARLGDRYTLPDASEGETRSHAFFFSPDPSAPDGASGMLGLPVARRAEPAMHRFFGSSAAMLFLRRDERRLAPAGELAARSEGVADDGCQASCADWYGNARPIFLGDRTFALLGYELVEGRFGRSSIREVARTNFAPRQSRPPAR